MTTNYSQINAVLVEISHCGVLSYYTFRCDVAGAATAHFKVCIDSRDGEAIVALGNCLTQQVNDQLLECFKVSHASGFVMVPNNTRFVVKVPGLTDDSA